MWAIAAGMGAVTCSLSAVASDLETAAASDLQEVIVTGSSIPQKPDSASLPVTILTSEEIGKTGFTSVTDLIQSLPAMQGFVSASSSVNGGGGGVTTAALHSLASKYTLVLVDGQRMAGFQLGVVQGEGFGVNLDSIPLSAIDHIEVLTDGASALYGADAIAGVVNLVLKKGQTQGTAYVNASLPEHTGGSGWNAGITKGIGNLSRDGWNVLFTFSHDAQDRLAASERPVSSQGAYFPFSIDGTRYLFNSRSSNTEPANVIISQLGVAYNPYYQTHGNCGDGTLAAPLTAAGSTTCRFNYAAGVDDVPAYKRDGGLLKGAVDLHEAGKVWAEALVSQFDMSAQYAAAAQPFGVTPAVNEVLWNNYVVPYLTATGRAATSATIGYRAVSEGGRTDDWQTRMRHLVLGWDGSYSGWSLKATLVDSHGVLTDYPTGGYLDSSRFFSDVASGAYNPVTGAGANVLSAALLGADFSQSTSDVTTLTFDAQRGLFRLPGGPSLLSVGGEYDHYRYAVAYSSLSLSQSGFSTQPAGNDYPIGGNYARVPFEADRDNWGLFGEWLLPLLSELNATASVRFDDYEKVRSEDVFSAGLDSSTGLHEQLSPAPVGNTFSDTTFKLSVRYTPIDSVSFRGSYGTGFKAPNLNDISGALVLAGGTTGSYPCPFPASAGCLPGSAQYDVLKGPNGQSGAAGLKPETSRQFGVGVRFMPVSEMSVSLDYWNIKITHQIESAGIAQPIAFDNPAQYKSLFVNPYRDPAGFETIAFEQVPFNGGEARYSGVDLTSGYQLDFPFGHFTANWTGTYMLQQRYTDGPGLPELTDLGVYGPDQQVVFRVISNVEFCLETGQWMNTLTTRYRSGYRDESYTAGNAIVFLANPDRTLGVPTAFAGLAEPGFTTFDWQTAYSIRRDIRLTAGVRNIADKAPPLALQTGGGGNQVGYDGRYYDPTGRTFYMRVEVMF